MSTRRHKTLVEVAATLRGHRRVPDTTTKELLAKVAKLRVEGKNWREVGAALGREHTTVYRTVKRWPLEYERALRKLKRPIDRRAERLASRLEREDVLYHLELLRLNRAAGRVISEALEDPKISIKLRAANAYFDYLDRDLPERVLSLYSGGPVADDKKPEQKKVAPLARAANDSDDDLDDLLARDEWINDMLETLGPDNWTDEKIMRAVFDKIDSEPDAQQDEEYGSA